MGREIENRSESSHSNTNLTDLTIKDSVEYDGAFRFVNDRGTNPSVQIVSSKVIRKIDLRILSLLCAIYFLQFLDKSLLNYAAAMGIKKNLKGNEFANLSTIFYAAYIFGEPFVAYLLQVFPLAKTLGLFIVCWGIVVACHAACESYAALMVVRTLLGIFEASSAVSLIIISGMFYTKPQQASRMGIWSVMSGVATIVGGLLSFGFQHVHTTRLLSWQILFLFMGIITTLFGVFVAFYLPNNVTDATFLSDDEKAWVLENVRVNQTGTISKKFKKEQIFELLFSDKFTWPFFLLTLVSQIVTGSVGTFSVTVTLSFGFDSYESALLQIPVGVLIIVIIGTATQLVSRFGHITYITISMFVPSVIGAIMLLATNYHKNKIANLFGLYLIYSGSSVITLIYAWVSANTAGTSKKFFRSGMTMIAFSIACIIGPQLFQANSAPGYRPAKITILVTQVLCIPLTFLMGYLARQENSKRDSEEAQDLPANYEFLDLTDIQNRSFRYIH
ncbi:putative allantoate permease [Suhomyces tanzawaensis NRRL Y-17324]|uniref:Putative allantoate permease n=1 Tax=Suhomyces tanzawaensis NRRL Y-17324 TaxID=984487 RepID=A0A1E4SP07_9ASCO|nr:putative allantoate permease [Suhomyces tanzawaensis NRRL Y-17324]ODV81218.1 putative allantoate permease [Suhomyces tanzawaensis NRRL Y-17324]